MDAREQLRVRVYIYKGSDKLLVNMYDLINYEFDEDLIEDLAEDLLNGLKVGESNANEHVSE